MKRTILIAGGTTGVGLETVNRLVNEDCQVVCACRSPEKLPDHPSVSGFQFDANRPDPPFELPDKLDGFVYCPGTINLKPFHLLSDQDFLDDLQVNLLSGVCLLREASSALKKGDSPAVVFFSTVAVQTGLPFHASVAAAKGAVEGLVRSLAAEMAPEIRVNVIAPSLTDTPLAAPLLNSEKKRQSSAERHPLNRIGDPSETARLVEFLLGADSGFMTGQVLRPDGGLSSLKML